MCGGRGWLVRVAALVVAGAAIWLIWGGLRPGAGGRRTADRQEAVRPPIEDLAVTRPLNQPGGGPVAEAAYAVYSDLYREQAGEPLAFSAATGTDLPQLNGSCLRPRTAGERELAAAFEAANRLSQQWEARFQIAGGYRLLPDQQAWAAAGCIEGHFAAAGCQGFQGLEHVRWLGAPGFSADGRRALVSVIKRCGRYCGSGGVFEVERTGGRWRRAAASAFTDECSWMY